MIQWLLGREMVTSWFLSPNHSLKSEARIPERKQGGSLRLTPKRSPRAGAAGQGRARTPVPVQGAVAGALRCDCQDRGQGPKAPTERPAVSVPPRRNQHPMGPPPAPRGLLSCGAGLGLGQQGKVYYGFHRWTGRPGRRGICQIFNIMSAERGESTSAPQQRSCTDTNQSVSHRTQGAQ